MPFSDHDRLVDRYGKERAEWLLREMFKNYSRLALSNAGQYETDRCRAYGQRTAARFGLRFMETLIAAR